MLDENLPSTFRIPLWCAMWGANRSAAFFLKAPNNNTKHNETFYFTQHGSEPEAQYSLKHVDPVSPEAKNTYAVGLLDAFTHVVYGEVLAKPGWTLPTLSQEEIRKNGGTAPPPSPIFPTEFAIQLYSPDQQVVVTQHTAKWSGGVSYEFSMPQTSFRTPSASTLDQSQDDPGKDAVTPMLNFVWRKEGRLGKDMTCYLTGKSTDIVGKKAKKSKEPDIAIALFSGLKEISIMEPNLYRVEMEDYKGLEVVLLLGAAVIRDLFFGNPREAFHIDSNTRTNSGGLRTRKGSSPVQAANITPPVMTPQPPRPAPMQKPAQSYPNEKALEAFSNQRPQPDPRRASLPPLHTGAHPAPRPDPRLGAHPNPRPDPRPQHANANLSTRPQPLPQAATRPQPQPQAASDQERKRREDAALKARKKAEEEEERKTRKFLEQEERQRKHEEKQREKERRRKQAEVDKETERLRKQFGDQSNLLPAPRPPQPQRHSAPLIQQPFSNTYRPSAQRPSAQRPPAQPPRPVATQPLRPAGLYLQPPGPSGPATSSSSFFSNGLPKPDAQKMKKKSFWGLRSGEDKAKTLHKKQSSMF